jgi:hypothetical protein
MAKLSKTAQWMLDHPEDTPPPSGHEAARQWRIKRGLDGHWDRLKKEWRDANPGRALWDYENKGQ